MEYISPRQSVINAVGTMSNSTSGLELWASEMWQVCATFDALWRTLCASDPGNFFSDR